MKLIIKILVAVILIFVTYFVFEVNAKILTYTDKIYFDWLNESVDDIMPVLKAFGISIATVVIIITYKSKWIRGLFITLDGSIIFMYQFLSKDQWINYTSAYYGIITALILLFVGNLAHKYYINSNPDEINLNDNEFNRNELEKLKIENRIKELPRLMANLKRGRSNKPWNKNLDKVRKMDEYEKELTKLKNI